MNNSNDKQTNTASTEQAPTPNSHPNNNPHESQDEESWLDKADQLDDNLVEMLEKAVPLVDSTADAFRFVFFVGAGLLAWIFTWMFFLKDFSLTSSLITIGIAAIPLLLLFRFWIALEELKDLPNIARRVTQEVTQDVKTSINGLKSSPSKGKLNLIGQIKNLFQLKGLIGELDDIFGQYLSIVTLLNPVSLILTVLSLLFVFALIFIGLILIFF